jgi:hypothetical protein
MEADSTYRAIARHMLRQSVVSAIMTMMMNSLMTFVLLYNGSAIPTWGTSGAVFDLLPTTFMSILMSTVMPGILTEKAVRSGELRGLPIKGRAVPGNVFVRALILAMMGTIVFGWLFAMAFFMLGIGSISFAAMLALKAIYGTLLGWFAAPVAVRQALAAAMPSDDANSSGRG